MKDYKISILNYHFNYFFQYYTHKYNIHIISHHFSNYKVEGMTIIDEFGTTISYERKNPKVKQNFTLCHELGHVILQHEGLHFMKSISNKEDAIEREANIFTSILLMPDIVLLSKIYYNCESFQQLQKNLEVSKKALCFRLLDLLKTFFATKETLIKQSIVEYVDGQNASLLILLHEVKEKIIDEFSQYKPSLNNQIKKRLEKTDFITSRDVPELSNQEKWDLLKKENPQLKIWMIYNRGKTIAYAWDKNKLSEKEARKKADLQLLLM